MGLDISVYSGLKYHAPVPEDGDYDWRRYAALYPNPHFPTRADGLQRGLYTFAEEGAGFRAGSYGGYNAWRRDLADHMGYTPEQAWRGDVPAETPFLPLVNFSDCEGVIGPLTSARLHADFVEQRQRVFATTMDFHFRELYTAWTEAFLLAARQGAVCFH